MTSVSAIRFVEQFHLLFLAQLGRRLNPSLFVLKGGCNLRFFLESVRYSEDMDLDLGDVGADVFRDKVRDVLASRPFAQILEARGIAIERVSAPKQTETTQRWKFGLRLTAATRNAADEDRVLAPRPGRRGGVRQRRSAHRPGLPAAAADGQPLRRRSRAATEDRCARRTPRDAGARRVRRSPPAGQRRRGVLPRSVSTSDSLERASRQRDGHRLRDVQEPGARLPGARRPGALRLAFRLGHHRPRSGGRASGGPAMRLVDVLTTLGSMDARVFTTREAATRLRVPNAHASVLLARLAAAGHLVRLRRGVWAAPGGVDPLALPELLTAPFPAYVSLQSALYLHGMISQMPAVTYAVTLARTRRYATPLGVVSLHHVQPVVLLRLRGPGGAGARLATPEKALVDFLYLTPARSELFRALARTRVAEEVPSVRSSRHGPTNRPGSTADTGHATPGGAPRREDEGRPGFFESGPGRNCDRAGHRVTPALSGRHEHAGHGRDGPRRYRTSRLPCMIHPPPRHHARCPFFRSAQMSSRLLACTTRRLVLTPAAAALAVACLVAATLVARSEPAQGQPQASQQVRTPQQGQPPQASGPRGDVPASAHRRRLRPRREVPRPDA